MTTPQALRSVCPQCGAPFARDDKAGRCRRCQPKRGGQTEHTKGTTGQRGYDDRWRRLSERARALQPFCSDCGSPDDLTTDHTPAAWERREQGKPIRLQDIDVVCRRCNTDRGAARGQHPTDRHDRARFPCPVCRRAIEPSYVGNVLKHRDTLGQTCLMSGQPFPPAEP